ncbi:MAG: hypothetical protein LIP08_00340 [Bacteroides sp.]|nr:hypothetical protein [Bacteroides sp.]
MTSTLGLTENTYFSFDAEGGQVTYYKVSQGIDNRGKFGGFDVINTGKIK